MATQHRKQRSRTRYELYYWPSIQGRGEFVRLALEEADADYVDVARLPSKQGGVDALMRLLGDPKNPRPSFAPPILKVGRQTISQTANILQFLGPRLGLVPASETDRLWAHQLQLTVADFIGEAHDTHHPIGVSLYYEDQKPAALRRAELFVKERMPKFLGYFEEVLKRNSRRSRRGGWTVGSRLTYVDLSLFQVVAGLRYSFPNAMRNSEKKYPRLVGLSDRVASRPNIAAYLDSPRRIPFNEYGLFRYYEELDV